MTESANVASVIFLTHMVTLTLLLLLGLIYALANTDIFAANMRAPFPRIDIVDTVQAGTVGTALFYGYSSVGYLTHKLDESSIDPVRSRASLYLHRSDASLPSTCEGTASLDPPSPFP
jgi:hypothetical protein